MTIYLIRFSGEKRKIKKTLQDYKQLTGTCRYPIDISDPIIDIDTRPTIFTIGNYNYVYIKEFDRYYIIKRYEYMLNNMLRLYLHGDVALSFYDSYKSTNVYVFRTANSSKVNKFIPDDLQPYDKNNIVSYIVPTTTSGVTLNTLSPNLAVATDYCILVSVITNRNAGSGIFGIHSTNYAPTISSATVGGGLSTEYYLVKWSDVNTFIASFYNNDTKKGFVKRIVAYPINLRNIIYSTPISLNQIYIGDSSVSTGAVYLSGDVGARVLLADFTLSSGTSYLDYSPYTEYNIWLPYYGYKTFNAEDILGIRIQIYITINFENGESTLYVKQADSEKQLFSSKVPFGTYIGVSSSNTLEYENAREAAALTSGVQVGLGAVAVMAGTAMALTPGLQGPGIGLVMGGGSNIMNGAAQGVSKYEQTYRSGSAEASTSVIGLDSPQTVHIKKVSANVSLSSTQYQAEYGLPTAFKDTIANCEGDGMTCIKEILLDVNITTGTEYPISRPLYQRITDNEYQELERVLKDGVIL